MSISESDVGLNVAATRQKAGTLSAAGAGAAPPRCPPAGAAGGVNVPAGRDSANVIVVFGSEVDFKLAHGVVATAALKRTTAKFAIILTSEWEENYHKSVRNRYLSGERGSSHKKHGIPILAKGGVDATSKKCREASFDGTDTASVATRLFLNGAATPPLQGEYRAFCGLIPPA